MSSAELRSEGPIQAGSTFQTVFMGQKNDVTLAEYDRPGHAMVAASSAMMDIDTTDTFTGVNAGTTLVVTTDVRPTGVLSVFSPLLRLMVGREVEKTYDVDKRACEDEPGPTSG